MLLLLMRFNLQKGAICHIYDGIRSRKGRLAHDCGLLVNSMRSELDSKYLDLEWKCTNKILRSRVGKVLYISDGRGLAKTWADLFPPLVTGTISKISKLKGG